MAYPTSAFENDAQRNGRHLSGSLTLLIDHLKDVKALRSKGGKDEQPKNGEEGTEIGVRDFFPEVWLFNDFNIGLILCWHFLHLLIDRLNVKHGRVKGIAFEFDAPFDHRMAFPRHFLVCGSLRRLSFAEPIANYPKEW